jgi:2'-5' RNA ligase
VAYNHGLKTCFTLRWSHARFFVAIPLTDHTKQQLLAIQPMACSAMRLIGEEELHLTLHFLGDLSGQSAESARHALNALRSTELSITINGLGYFSSEGKPSILWAKVEQNPDLDSIHHALASALADAIGFQAEDRPYSPHITLARLNGNCPGDLVQTYVRQKADFNISHVLIKQFGLYSSIFVDGIPRYRQEATFALFNR